MTAPELTLPPILAVISILLQIAALTYCYRIAKFTGIFLGWSLVIIGIGLGAVVRMWRFVPYFMTGLSLFETVTETIALTQSLVLFVGFYEINRLFKRQSNKQPHGQAAN